MLGGWEHEQHEQDEHDPQHAQCSYLRAKQADRHVQDTRREEHQLVITLNDIRSATRKLEKEPVL